MDIFTQILESALFAITPFLAVLVISFFFRVFAREEFPTWMSIFVGLTFVGFDGGISEIATSPSLDIALKVFFVAILSVWGCRFGDKLAERIPRSELKMDGYHLLRRGLYKVSGKNFVELVMPKASEIQNIYGKRPVSNDLKKEIAGKRFVEPADLPVEVIEARIRRRLITDWRVGDAEVKLNEHGVISKLALASRKSRISNIIPEDKVLFSFKPESIPFEMGYGDIIHVVIENKVICDVEVLNVGDGIVSVMLVPDEAENLAKLISSRKVPSVIIFPYKSREDVKSKEIMTTQHTSKTRSKSKK
jgi:hypothetical protein